MLKFEVRAAQEKPHDPQNTEVFLKIAFCFFRGQIYEAQNSDVIQKHIRVQRVDNLPRATPKNDRK